MTESHVLVGVAIVFLVAVAYGVFKERNYSIREGSFMAAWLLASIGLQLAMGERYRGSLNTLSLLCMVGFWRIYSRNVMRRINKKIVENRIERATRSRTERM